MKNVTLRQLKVFEAVARHLSFSRAAEELHLTQPAVSMQVRSLEEDAGLPLTDQIGKKIVLTTAGAELARHARLIAQQLRAAEEALAAIRGVRGGQLKIGVVSTAKYFAPRLLAVFRSRHPGVELHLGVHNRERIVQQLADNEIDLAIMGRPPAELNTIADAFAANSLVFIAAPDHPLAARHHIAPTSLAQESFMIREPGSGTRSAMERFFAEQEVVLGHTFVASSNETIKQAVMAGMGIAFISSRTIELELAVGKLVTLNVVGTPIMRQWHLVRRAEMRPFPLADAFRKFLCEEGTGLMDGKKVVSSAPAKRRTRREEK